MSILKDLGLSADGGPLDAYLRIGRSLGRRHGTVITAADSGRYGAMVFNALSSGIVSAGGDVRNIGIAPAPTLAMAAKGRGAGLMVCSPDDEADIVGMRFWNMDGTMFGEPHMSSLRRSLADDAGLPPYGSVGSVSEQSGALAIHRNAILGEVGASDCPVVLDCSSDCASFIAPALLTDMGCDLVTINSQPNMRSPSKRREMDEGGLRGLIDLVHRNEGEIGIAVNGDGTRMAAVDESARYIGGETLLALFAQYLKPKRIVVPVTASMIIDDLTDGEVIRTAPGDANIGNAVLEHDADLGGSPGGSFIFPRLTCCPDAVYGAALTAKIAGEGRLNEMVDALPRYHMKEAAMRYDGRRPEVEKRIAERVRGSEHRGLTETDGWRVDMDGGWYLIRFSHTDEHVIRITAEARDEVYMVGLMDIAKDIVNRASK